MKFFCVSYDLSADDYDNYNYEIIEEKLLDLDSSGQNIQGSVWVLELDNNWTPKLLRKELEGCINEEDSLFIAEIVNNYELI